MTSRRRRDTPRGHAARLGCGTVLTYAASSLVPDVGENVPCPRHGYCPVSGREGARGGRTGTFPVPPRRSTSELAQFLAPRLVTTVAVLRRNRFTLRVVATAQKEGLVDVDLVSGRVALRSGLGQPLESAG
jgi:hypothetical protein